MKLHSDTITRENIVRAATDAGCNIEAMTEHRSGARTRAYNVTPSGHGKVGGQYGLTSHASASWDDWGIILAALFAVDAHMIVGTPGRPTYDGVNHFHAETVYRYKTLTPAQAHHAHKRDRSTDSSTRYMTEGGRYLTRCKGAKGAPCDAYI